MKLLFSKMLTQEGWARDVLVETDAQGMIATLATGASETTAPRVDGVAIPGVPNAHSHAHQRLLAGLAEAGGGRGDFMRWRELMYRAVRKFDPDSFQAVAALAYTEMLKAGYTSVAEFHYRTTMSAARPTRNPPRWGCVASRPRRTPGSA